MPIESQCQEMQMRQLLGELQSPRVPDDSNYNSGVVRVSPWGRQEMVLLRPETKS